jgi:hypothetical protein
MTDRDLQQKRIVAAVIDIGIAFVIFIGLAIVSFAITFVIARGSSDSTVAHYITRVIGFLSSLLGLGYVLGRDVLGGDRSLGKKMQNIRIVTVSGAPVGFMDSVRRNAIFAIGSILGLLSATLQLVPCLGDAVACMLLPLQVLGGLVSLGAAIFELIKITSEPEGIRMGDQMAGTRVVR